jgi:hypothetical protein
LSFQFLFSSFSTFIFEGALSPSKPDYVQQFPVRPI